MTIRIIDRKTKKVTKILLVSLLIIQVALLFFTLFGDVANLPGTQFLNTIFVVIFYNVLDINLNITDWLIKRSYSELLLMNVATLAGCYIFYEQIQTMISQLIKDIGKKLCGEECCVKNNS